ncbi:DUF4062 domain-containing protein [Caulobacter mirabilis]|uniref:DUF4062 domain-containing protein n=1 Tax=Caulobacter mirabilis TaxID=69666 RepID=A0A2D2AWV7_9CAUL|nr:DUF4062 domain-containing protein [Caulobacter mirabilis]ATQ42465.1 hypothetical protein CSW64_08580 [Caulobacter mirabilis]
MKRKLQVFISSTYSDLLVERQAAVLAVLKAGHIPAGMELFTAGDKSQLDTIKRWIDESDVYMLILGGRYGSIEPSSSLSYTELEYDYAVSEGKPLFSVVINDQALEDRIKSEGSKVMEGENPSKLKEFRTKVLSNISSFFSDEKDIKLAVHESLSDFAAKADLSGWVSRSEIPNVKALTEEIEKLREENRILKESPTEKRIESTKEKPSDKVQETINILHDQKITVPANVMATGEDWETTALHFFVSNRENLINGATNSINSSDAETFMYGKIAPKLIVHGVMENEKVPGARYRRSSVTKFGQSVLAELDRRGLKKKTTKPA